MSTAAARRRLLTRWWLGLLLVLIQLVLLWRPLAPAVDLLLVLALLTTGFGLWRGSRRCPGVAAADGQDTAGAGCPPMPRAPVASADAVRQELADVARQLDCVEGLVHDAAQQLGAAFSAMQRQGQAREAAVQRLIEAMEETAPGLSTLARSASGADHDARSAAAALAQIETLRSACAQEAQALAHLREQSAASAAQVIRCLQFEDMTAQALSAARQHLERMCAQEAQGEMRLLRKPVTQASVEAGSVELY